MLPLDGAGVYISFLTNIWWCPLLGGISRHISVQLDLQEKKCRPKYMFAKFVALVIWLIVCLFVTIKNVTQQNVTQHIAIPTQCHSDTTLFRHNNIRTQRHSDTTTFQLNNIQTLQHSDPSPSHTLQYSHLFSHVLLPVRGALAVEALYYSTISPNSRDLGTTD